MVAKVLLIVCLCLIALILFNQKKAKNLTYIRTSIQSKDGEIGFIPGDLDHKTEWMNAPLYEKLEELLTKPDINKLEKENYPIYFESIKIVPRRF